MREVDNDTARASVERRRLDGVGARMLVSAGVVAAAAALAGLSTWASFTDSTSGSHAVSTGVVDLELGAAGGSGNRLDVPALNLAPGDVVDRALDLHNSSSVALTGVTLTTSTATSSSLDSDSVNGLKIGIERCSTTWAEVQVSGVYTYTCLGVQSSALSTRPVAVTSEPLSGVPIGAGGGTAHLRVRMQLPAAAGNAFQGLASDMSLTFTGVQRAATSR